MPKTSTRSSSTRSSSPSSYSRHRTSPHPPLPLPPPPPPISTPIDLQKCCQSPRLLPAASIAYASRSVLTDPFAYADALLCSSIPLRAAITDWLNTFYNTTATAEELYVTAGKYQALEGILQKFSDPVFTRSVWLLAPSPRGCKTIFEDCCLGSKIRFVPEDKEGIDIEALERGLCEEEARATAAVNLRPAFKSPTKYPKIYRHIIHLTPTFRDPTGSTISLDRRTQLVSLARRYDALIVADDAGDFLRWDAASPQITPMVFLDASLPGRSDYGNAVSSGDFSVLVAPGCRVGWVQGTTAFVEAMGRGAEAGGLEASCVWNLLTTGTLRSFLEDVLIPTYSKRHKVVLEAVGKYLSPLGVKRRGDGGWYLWLDLPDWCDVPVLVERLKKEEKLVVGHVGVFEGGGGEEGLRICLAWEEEARIEEGVKRIAEAMVRLRRKGHIDVKDLLG
ncbi:putative aminotransferase [Tricharina praecox]|uniref:putative aminotransferase n=1 Tax=Tricharina praecox TaxID=43433 RepID=UPI00221EDFFE|nr:putative aminotransferase [Tricharina praecox]KAI5856330.1 putative aminotransferase [Tricharina praecox]